MVIDMVREKKHMEEYRRWLENSQDNDNLKAHLEKMTSEDVIREAFHKDLEFGTSGLRGVMGVGTNRMNEVVINRVTRGVVDYLYERENIIETGKRLKVLISYDGRLYSREFAQKTAEVFAQYGIIPLIFDECTAVSVLSYGIRQLDADLGIMITASHNNKKYNGYKVYDNRGCQILEESAQAILEKIDKIAYFEYEFRDVRSEGDNITENPVEIQWLDGTIEKRYVDDVIRYFQNMNIVDGKLNLAVVYTPLNGTGKRPVISALEKIGLEKLISVDEQMIIDGKFSTCPNPNPELDQVYELGRNKLEENQCDIVVATDPDCDRAGVFTRNRRLSGNEIGILIFHFLCEMRKRQKDVLGKRRRLYKSIVSTKIVDEIAKANDIEIEKTLIGFKFMGNAMDKSPKKFLFAFEEGNGYLTNNLIRDKDGISAAVLICIVTSWWKKRGKTLEEALKEIYDEYGYFKEENAGYDLEGIKGKKIIENSMSELRENISVYAETLELDMAYDYLTKRAYGSSDNERAAMEKFRGLPESNILEFESCEGVSVIIRPSGTEPKLKIYFSARGAGLNIADAKIEKIKAKTLDVIKGLIHKA